MSRFAFLVDECLPASVDRGLQRRIPQASVVRVGDEAVPPVGSTDAELLSYCLREHRLLVTADRSSMPAEVERHRSIAGETWGVWTVRPGSALVRVLNELELVYHASEAEEWVKQME